MNFIIRKYIQNDSRAVTDIINEIIRNGANFPWYNEFSEDNVKKILSAETGVYCACADGKVVGFYAYQPNMIDRCSHIANASYGVKKEYRGNGIGRALVEHSLKMAKADNFMAMQFNGVVSTNYAAKLYKDIGFKLIGTIEDGFRLKDGSFTDTFIFYKKL